MNPFEKRLKEELERENPDCVVLRNGWPDFAVVNKTTGKMVKAVEGKAPGDFIRPHQSEIHRALQEAGVPVETYFGIGSDFHVETAK